MASPDLPVTVEDLKKLIPSVSNDAADIFISSADAIVQEKLIPTFYAPETTYLIELYLAAYFATAGGSAGSGFSGAMSMRKVGNSEERFADAAQALYGIANNQWGQMAMLLDTQGILADMAAKPLKAQFKVY